MRDGNWKINSSHFIFAELNPEAKSFVPQKMVLCIGDLRVTGCQAVTRSIEEPL
jgi:hypothetical protein